jgi:protein-disulfide isomerase
MKIISKKWTLFISIIPILGILTFFSCTKTSDAKDKKPNYEFKDGTGPNGALVVINGKAYSEEELMGEDKLEFADVMKKLYDMRMERVGRLLLENAYGEKAKKENMSLDEYIEKKVLSKNIKISDSEFNKFVEEKHIPKDQLNPQLKERIQQYMIAQKKSDELQAHIAKLSKSNKVEIYFKKPDIKVNVDIGNAPSFGNKDAKVKIVEFSDFQCPFCSRAANTVKEIKKQYGNKVLFAFKQFPLPMHPQAQPASEAALCVNKQSTEKFWKYHDKLFENQDKLENADLKKYAQEVGVNMDEFNKCFDSHEFAQAVKNDLEYGSKIGVRSTPTFFINGKLISGAQPFEVFKEAIEEEM